MDLSGQLIQGTGSYEVKEITDDSAYPLMDKGDKYLECTASGTVGFPSDQAYGEWEFDLYKGVSNDPLIGFISNVFDSLNNTQGYWFFFRSTEAMRFLEATGSGNTILFGTVDSYGTALTWLRIKITRTLDGEFYLYVRGGIFGDNDWTLIDISGGSGTNPVTDTTITESQYFVIDLDAGDRIANIITRKAVQQ